MKDDDEVRCVHGTKSSSMRVFQLAIRTNRLYSSVFLCRCAIAESISRIY